MARLRRRWQSGWTPAALAACLALGAVPARASDAEPLYVSHEALAAVTADVDADGARELVIVTADGTAARGVEVWDHDGGWARSAAGALALPTDGGEALPLDPARQSVALLLWHRAGREHALLATSGDAGDYGGGCCLRLAVVRAAGGRVELEPIRLPDVRAEEVRLLDADADGTDELLVVEPPDGANDRYAQLLRWRDDALGAQRVPLGHDDRIGREAHVGETDGRPGEEAVFVVDGGLRLLRIGLGEAGRAVVERGEVADSPGVHLWSWGAGAGWIVVQHGTDLRVLRWPHGGAIETAARAARPEYPALAVVGDGREALIIDRGVIGFDPRRDLGLALMDASLATIDVIQEPQPVQRLWRLANVTMPALRGQLDSLQPYVGPFPGGLADGASAYLAAGNLITVGAEGGHAVRRMSSLTGLAPIGFAGPGGTWWVLDDGHLGRPDWAVMVVTLAGPRTVSVVPAADVLTPDDEEPLAVRLDDAVVVDTAAGERLHVPRDGFSVTVSGEPGSLVLGVLDQFVVHEGTLPRGSVTLPMLPLARRPEASGRLEAAVVRIDPAGRVDAVAWEGRIIDGPPELAASAETRPLAASATVRGRAPAGTRVSVDGAEVAVSGDGAFEAEVAAAVWPREVRVVARDPLGNETVQRLHVVGFLDYRALPWAAVLALATLGAGAFLFVRTPRPSASTAPAADGASLDEIDGEAS